MTPSCKNCKHSFSFKGQGGGKTYLCHNKPLKEDSGRLEKFEKTKPNAICDKYEGR